MMVRRVKDSMPWDNESGVDFFQSRAMRTSHRAKDLLTIGADEKIG